MDTLNINNLLNREEEVNKVKDILKNFELNKHNLITKKGIYIYGEPGSGKTLFINNILNTTQLFNITQNRYISHIPASNIDETAKFHFSN